MKVKHVELIKRHNEDIDKEKKGNVYKILFLSFSLFLILTARWFSNSFLHSAAACSDFLFVVPLIYDFDILLDFVLRCILPIIWVNWLIQYIIMIKSDSYGIALKERTLVSPFSMNYAMRAAYTIMTLVSLILFISRCLSVFWNFSFVMSEDYRTLFITSNEQLNVEGIFELSLIYSGFLLAIYLFFQPNITSLSKRGGINEH